MISENLLRPILEQLAEEVRGEFISHDSEGDDDKVQEYISSAILRIRSLTDDEGS